MTSNILLSFPQIPFAGSALAQATADTGFESQAIVTGPRTSIFRTASATQATTWDYAASATQQPDHLIIARADLLRKADSTATLWSVTGSASSAFTSPNSVSGTYGTGDLVGPRNEDLVVSLTHGSSYQYWRVKNVTTASVRHNVAKMYLGNWFDMGRDPIYGVLQKRVVETENNRDPRYVFDVEWNGISDQKRQDFIGSIVKWRDVNPVFVYDSADVMLNDVRLLHCWLTAFEFKANSKNNNYIKVTFEEAI